MKKEDWLAKDFEESRPHLKAVAYRMLGSESDAEDAVQEAWGRLAESEAQQIENLRAWLTTVVSRICLDLLRSRKSKRETPLEPFIFEIPNHGFEDPDVKLLMSDAVGPAMMVVLDLLTPTERIAFVLHDLFDLSFEEIAPMIDRSVTATRQLASRGRRRVKGSMNPREDSEHQKKMVSAFLKASREGNFEALIQLLHPEVTLRADEIAIQVSKANQAKGAPQFEAEMLGAKMVADTMKGKASGAQLAFVNGYAGATWAPGGTPVVAFCFSLRDGKISDIDVVMDPKTLGELEVRIEPFASASV